MNLFLQTVLSLLVGIVIAAFTSWITVRFALKQFYSQKWWERKADAYSSIIEALYRVKHNIEERLWADSLELEITEDNKKRLDANASKGYDEIYKAESIGAFVISEESSLALTRLRQQLEKDDVDWATGNEPDRSKTLSAVIKCLEDIRRNAKRDLNIQ